MRNVKWLTVGTLIVSLGMVGPASAQQCAAVLTDLAFPTGGEFDVGETIEYLLCVSVPPSPPFPAPNNCTLTDVNVYFFPPNSPPIGTACLDVDGGVLIASGLTLVPGADPCCYTSADNPALAYLVGISDLQDADGTDIVANMATTFFIEGAGNQQCDEKQITNTGVPLGPCVEVTKKVDCEVSKEKDTVTYRICVKNCDAGPITVVTLDDSVLGDLLAKFISECGDAILDPQEQCCFDVDYVIPPGSPDPLDNQVFVEAVDEFQQDANDLSEIVRVDIVHPDFMVTKDCQEDPVPPGGSAIFDVNIMNTGDIALCFTTDDPCIGPLTLDPGKLFEKTLSKPFDGNDVFNQILVTAVIGTVSGDTCEKSDPECLPNVIVKEANDTCHAGGDATRTPGFWKTHTDYTEHIFNVHCGGLIDLGWVVVDSNEDVFGVFWAHKSRNTDGSRRNKLCRARMHASFHALAAILNSCLDNGATLPVSAADIATILGGTDRNAIIGLAGILGDYNESGDDVTIIDNDGFLIGNADPKKAKEDANYALVDCINNAATKGRGKKK
ncbi:MAG: hypothetical protein ACYTEQ_07010 [Planctomycetota bacterium]|jgi:hypothetical protein